jgi:hypothetical protein
MKHRNRIASWVVCAAALFAAGPLTAAAQTKPAAPAATPALSDSDVAATQDQLLKLLRFSPVLTTVVSHDPSLLADQEYVSRNNPELAQFLVSHPDVARNPEFYLFSHLEQGHGRRDQALERAVWPDLSQPQREPSGAAEVARRMIPIIGLACFLVALVWVIRLFIESRRWNRSFKLQSEVHSRLIDKFTSTQELAAYMQTEAGRRFLEASPVALGMDGGMQMPNVVSRVLTPLSIGIVLALTGIGLMLLHNVGPDTQTPMLILGTLALMPGIGFILSAGATWVLAHRLGLLPGKDEARSDASAPNMRP